MNPHKLFRASSLLALALLVFNSQKSFAEARLINGTPVSPGTYQYVVAISTNGAPCSASLVGPKVLLTAAHCVPNGGTATFKVGNKSYSAKMTRSPIYNFPKSDHDIALGVVDQEVTGIDFVSVGGKASTGLGVQLLGTGCTQKPAAGETPVSDGILRIGSTVITGFSNFDMVTRQAGGAAICFGDTGGPTLVKVDGKDRLVGLSTKGNLTDMTWSLRLDIPESDKFLRDFATNNGVKICGVTGDCGGAVVPTAPKCNLMANPSLVKKGETIVFSMIGEGNITSATIDGTSVSFPNGTKSMVASSIGTFTASGQVTGPGGTGSCSATYTVEDGIVTPQLPKCTLTANPDSVMLGQSITLAMQSTNATSGSIDGVTVNVPNGSRILTPSAKGSFTALGKVTNAVGSASCTASYSVEDSVNPETPNFAVVPVYCGENVVTETKVATVCIGVTKKDAGITDLRINQVIIVTYSDTSKEVLPIMARKPRAKVEGDVSVKEDLFLYANSAMGGKYTVLDSRTATLTKMVSNRAEVPMAIEGRTIKGKYFLVEKMSPVSSSNE